jgi:hypothetical protein
LAPTVGNDPGVVRTDSRIKELALATIGMVTVDQILPGDIGRITKIGKVNHLPTGSFEENQRAYQDPNNPGK